VNAQQRLPRERPPEPVGEQPMERADAERADRQPPDVLRLERSLELRGLRPFDEPPGQE
jgi:hypothetical protein